MEIEFDPLKSHDNEMRRGIPFSLATSFQFETAINYEDTRHAYGEVRYAAIGPINKRLHVLIFKETTRGIRVISLRKANFRETLRYEKIQRPHSKP